METFFPFFFFRRENIDFSNSLSWHDGISDPRRGIQALPHILTAGRQKGLRFVSIGTLMRYAREQLEAADEALPPERDGS